jgi:putative glutamine amidotransferase
MQNKEMDAPLKVAIVANSSRDPETGLNTQTLDNKYIDALVEQCGAFPIVVPTIFDEQLIDATMDLVDGLVLTGDASNVHPQLYGDPGTQESHGPFDSNRDTVALRIIHAAIRSRKPILGICRGLQEINVALGGTLKVGFIGTEKYYAHPKRKQDTDPHLIYRESHPLIVDRKTHFGSAFPASDTNVNSVHVQAIDQLAPDLRLVAQSEDGLIEAFEDASGTTIIGVQWHPEFNASRNAVSKAVFNHFRKLIISARG